NGLQLDLIHVSFLLFLYLLSERQVDSICEHDRRALVDPNTALPYAWIAKMETNTGNCTAFMVNVPRVSMQVVLTAGHCIDDLPQSVSLTFPGRSPVHVDRHQMHFPLPESGDYAAIILPSATGSSDGFGYNAVPRDNELTGRQVTITGYPDEKPQNTMWASGGALTRVDNSKLYYRIDTTDGQSGSPIYTWWNGYWTVVGIHTTGGCDPQPSTANSGQRLTLTVLDDILTWARYPWLNTTIQSLQFPNRFLRMIASKNKVNVQYNAYSNERFRILPVIVPPFTAEFEEYDTDYAIESVKSRNRFLRMDGTGVTSPKSQGGGTVNTQTYVGRSELSLIHI
ncbi:MAG: trypsin-like peptidase domain-containing protein, partial [Alphaproteobacteria bacterium]|nr:trypsin-like peptidase domain-containing protein [Alphaproteobacteria bacterium]